jgi:hypothetical protein
MMIGGMMRAAAAAAALVVFANAGVAGECSQLAKNVKATIDKVDPTKAEGNNPLKCAMFSEGLGLLKMYRAINEECLDEGARRTRELAELDRTIRKTQGLIDRNCQ